METKINIISVGFKSGYENFDIKLPCIWTKKKKEIFLLPQRKSSSAYPCAGLLAGTRLKLWSRKKYMFDLDYNNFSY